MKKIALTSLLTVMAFGSAHAATNYFVGGSAGISLDNEHETILNIAPEFGWKYNSDWDFGVAVHFDYDHAFLEEEIGLEGGTYTYGFGGFARYKVAEFGDFKLLLKGSVGIDFTTLDPEEHAYTNETVAGINGYVIPMITYDVSEAFTLYANLNFLGVHAGYNFKNPDLGIEDGWELGAAVDADNVANTGNFQIGFLYNF